MIDFEVDSLIIEFCKAKLEQPPNTSDKPESQLIDNTPRLQLFIETFLASIRNTLGKFLRQFNYKCSPLRLFCSCSRFFERS